MITNPIKTCDSTRLEIPQIVRVDTNDWIPSFDLWSTETYSDTCYIECTQRFGAKLKNYIHSPIDPKIGYYDASDKLVVHWKAIIDIDSINLIHNAFRGKLRGICWQKRYCVYYNTGSKTPWLHSVIMEQFTPNYVVHHVNGVSSDNRKQNLHVLPKKEHDSINHPTLLERKKMFENPTQYWNERRTKAILSLLNELELITSFEHQANFIDSFARNNLALAKEILLLAQLSINLSHIKTSASSSRTMNSHLPNNYLDTYEIEQFLIKNGFGYKPNSEEQNRQLRLF
jgi:hypothetical protein